MSMVVWSIVNLKKRLVYFRDFVHTEKLSKVQISLLVFFKILLMDLELSTLKMDFFEVFFSKILVDKFQDYYQSKKLGCLKSILERFCSYILKL